VLQVCAGAAATLALKTHPCGAAGGCPAGPSHPDGLHLSSKRIKDGLEAHISLPHKYCAFPGDSRQLAVLVPIGVHGVLGCSVMTLGWLQTAGRAGWLVSVSRQQRADVCMLLSCRHPEWWCAEHAA
jgi:hypothetical protein